MGIGVSLFLFAVGAVLTFAVEVTTSGLNINTVGIILMIVGAVGFLLSLVLWSSVGPWANRREERTVVRDREVL